MNKIAKNLVKSGKPTIMIPQYSMKIAMNLFVSIVLMVVTVATLFFVVSYTVGSNAPIWTHWRVYLGLLILFCAFGCSMYLGYEWNQEFQYRLSSVEKEDEFKKLKEEKERIDIYNDIKAYLKTLSVEQLRHVHSVAINPFNKKKEEKAMQQVEQRKESKKEEREEKKIESNEEKIKEEVKEIKEELSTKDELDVLKKDVIKNAKKGKNVQK